MDDHPLSIHQKLLWGGGKDQHRFDTGSTAAPTPCQADHGFSFRHV